LLIVTLDGFTLTGSELGMNPNPTVRRVPSIKKKGNGSRQIAEEIEEVKKQIQDQ
jgi:hypothetical protein